VQGTKHLGLRFVHRCSCRTCMHECMHSSARQRSGERSRTLPSRDGHPDRRTRQWAPPTPRHGAASTVNAGAPVGGGHRRRPPPRPARHCRRCRQRPPSGRPPHHGRRAPHAGLAAASAPAMRGQGGGVDGGRRAHPHRPSGVAPGVGPPLRAAVTAVRSATAPPSRRRRRLWRRKRLRPRAAASVAAATATARPRSSAGRSASIRRRRRGRRGMVAGTASTGGANAVGWGGGTRWRCSGTRDQAASHRAPLPRVNLVPGGADRPTYAAGSLATGAEGGEGRARRGNQGRGVDAQSTVRRSWEATRAGGAVRAAAVKGGCRRRHDGDASDAPPGRATWSTAGGGHGRSRALERGLA